MIFKLKNENERLTRRKHNNSTILRMEEEQQQQQRERKIISHAKPRQQPRPEQPRQPEEQKEYQQELEEATEELRERVDELERDLEQQVETEERQHDELEEMRKDYETLRMKHFYSVGFRVKNDFLQVRRFCNLKIGSLYEHAKNMDMDQWDPWIRLQLENGDPSFEHPTPQGRQGFGSQRRVQSMQQ